MDQITKHGVCLYNASKAYRAAYERSQDAMSVLGRSIRVDRKPNRQT